MNCELSGGARPVGEGRALAAGGGAAANKGMNRTRNKRASHRELGRSIGLCAPVIPGVRHLVEWYEYNQALVHYQKI